MINLPNEMLVAIFGYLSHSDRISIRLTCKTFYNASLAPAIIKDEMLKIDQRILKAESQSIITCLIKSSRIFYNCTISDVTNYEFCWVFREFGANLKSLKLKMCDLDSCQFTYMIRQCKNLEILHLITCDNLLIQGKIFYSTDDTVLNNLKFLTISDTIYLTDSILYKFIVLCPNIEYLSIKKCVLNCHQGVYYFNYSSTLQSPLENPSKNVLTIKFIKDLLKLHGKTIKGINFSKTRLNNTALSDICQLENIKLNYLNLNYCHELKNNTLMQIHIWQPYITELYLAACGIVTDAVLHDICLNLSDLSVLDISDCKLPTDEGIKHIKYLRKISSLDVSFCRKIKGRGISNYLNSNSLRVLKLNNLSINDSDVVNISVNLNLIELAIGNNKNITDIGFSSLFKHQKNLQKLTLFSTYITNSDIIGLNMKKHVRNVNFDKFQNILENQESILQESKDYYEEVYMNNMQDNSIDKLGNLKYLDLSKCPYLTDKVFRYAFCFKNLQTLDISHTKTTTKGLCFLIYNCVSLESLDVSGCPIDDISICLIVNRLNRLKCLFIKDCWKLTNLSLQLILQHCTKLKVLNIEGCSNICITLMEKIEKLSTVTNLVGRPNEIYFNSANVPLPPPPPMPMT